MISVSQFGLEQFDLKLDANAMEERNHESLPSSSADVPDTANPTGLAFRGDLVDDLARRIPDDFWEGREALDRLGHALEELARSTGGNAACLEASVSTASAASVASAGPSELYAMMVAIERRAARVERALEGLSEDALEIVSSALIHVDVGVDDERGTERPVHPHQQQETQGDFDRTRQAE